MTNQKSLDKKKTNIEIVDTDIFSIGTDGGNKPIKPINLDKNKPKVDYSKPVEPIMSIKNWEKEFEKVLNDYNCVIEASEEVYQDGRKVVKQFIKQLLTQQRTELLEEIRELIDSCYWICGTNYVVNGKQEKMISKSEIIEKFTNLLNKKDE